MSPTGPRHEKAHRDEKALNAAIAVALGRCLAQYTVEAERGGQLAASSKQPDIVVDAPSRERVLVENKYETVAPAVLEQQCLGHFGARWAADDRPVRVVVGMRSPQRLNDFSDEELHGGAFLEITFQWAMWSVNGDQEPVRFPASGWLEGKITDLAASIDRAGAEGADVSSLAELLRMRLDAAASVATQPVGVADAFGEVLSQEPGAQTNRMAMAIMFNAVLFQFHIAQHHPHIPTPIQMMSDNRFNQLRVLEVWREILDMNYWPIFEVSRRLLLANSGARASKQALEILSRTAADIVEHPGASGLVGRLFGELIGDRKFLATFYTRPASAALLAELAVDRLEVDWSEPKAVTDLRIGDMACGTGALLTEMYRRVVERHRIEGGDDADIHRGLIEEVMIGCDIMGAAVHLTAARLSGERPDIDYANTKTWLMPYGKHADNRGVEGYRIGALDLLHSDKRAALWGDGTMAVTAEGEEQLAVADIPSESLDVVIMNPPFTRPTNHEGGHAEVPNPAFAGLGTDPKEQRAMSDALRVGISRISGLKASHGNAGIASNFIDLAHAKLRPGGVLALIVPASLVTGTAWSGARALLAAHYRDIVIVSISEHGEDASEGRAFSADTGMAEVMVVATKNDGSVPGVELDIEYVILHERPASPVSGIEAARQIRSQSQRPGMLMVGGETAGLSVIASLGSEMKGQPIGISRLEVAAAASELAEGRLLLPRHRKVTLPVTQLHRLGIRGPVHRDISDRDESRGPFDVRRLADRSAYRQASWPILWSHDHRAETSMRVLPCSEGVLRAGMRESAVEMWEGRSRGVTSDAAGATRLHLNADFQVNAQATGACLTPTPVIGGRAWPSFSPTPDDEADVEEWEKALCVWLNSTLGLLGRWYASNRQQKGRANLTVTTMGAIPVLDLRAVAAGQRQALAAVFDEFEERAMLPANEAYRDEVRQALDESVLCGALDFPETILDPLATLRWQWCAEPSVHGGKSTRPPKSRRLGGG